MKLHIFSLGVTCLVMLMLVLSVSPAVLQAQSSVPTTQTAQERYNATLQSILSQLLSIRNILLERQSGVPGTPVVSAPAGNSSNAMSLVPDGSTFGIASVITSVVVAPSDDEGMSITMKSDKSETVIASVIRHREVNERTGIIINSDKPYSAEVIYYRFNDSENPVRESSGRLTQAEVVLEMREAAESDYELADNVRRFLLENPVKVRVPQDSNRTRVMTDECYEQEDRDMMIGFIKKMFDSDNLRYQDLDTIVKFSVPAQEGGWYSNNGECVGTFTNTL